MKYCCTESERKGTCYHEFQKGKFNNSFWYKDSLLLHDDNLCCLHLGKFFKSIIPSYDECGETEITKEQWRKIYLKASQTGGEIKNVIDEINDWAEEVFKTEDLFTILGI